jgi:hypothetical protein
MLVTGYFDPLSVKGIPDQSANDADMRAGGGRIDLVLETLARGLGIGLS